MVGRDLTNRFPDKTNKPGEVILEVEHLTAKRPKSIEDVSFTLRKGEILGIAGLVGSKRTDIVETLFGVIEKKSGTVKIDGKEVNIRNPKEATKNGLALITEERRATGIYSMLDIKFNSIISNTRNYKALLGLLDNSKIEKDTKWVTPSSSGISEEIIIIPFSFSARFIINWYISNFAPTSIPLVGSSIRSISGAVSSHLPIITFC